VGFEPESPLETNIILTMKPKKIIAWILIILGILVIFWTLYSSYNIFTAKTNPPGIFKLQEKKEVLEKEGFSGSLEKIEQQMQEMVKEELKDIIPSEFISRILNLIAWSIFAGILIFGGSRISGIGINLLRRS